MKRFITTSLIALTLLLGVTAGAQAQIHSSVSVLNGSCSAPSITFFNDTDTGFYLSSAGVIGVCINGASVATINSSGIASTVTTGTRVTISQADGYVEANSASYGGVAARQAVSGDLNLAAGAGTSVATDHAYLAGVMGNAIRTGNLTATKNTVAGVVGKYDITGTNASTYPGAAIKAEIGDNSTSAIYAVLAAIGGDTAASSATGAFGVDFQSSVPGSLFQWGVDLQGNGTHDSYLAPRYSLGDIRLGGRRTASTTSHGDDVCINRFNAAPVDGASGTFAGNCGPGSILLRTDATGGLYQNTGTLASPTWTAR